MTIDEDIRNEGMAKLNKDPVFRANMLSNLGDIKTLNDYANRKKIADLVVKQKRENQDAINQMEIETCQNLLTNAQFSWWLTNILLPLTQMPKDDDRVTIDEKTRRLQIEAMTYDKLLNRILEKGKKAGS